jgi:hypothetical protein
VLVLLAAVLLGIGVAVMVVAGVSSQLDEVRVQLAAARETLTGWLADAGVDAGAADAAGRDVSAGVSDAVPALLRGLGAGLAALSSAVVFAAFTALSLFFVLKDGPTIRRWAERATRLPGGIAHQMGDRVLASLRGYFRGVTIVAAYNALVVVAAAAIVGVPLLGAIAVVTFLGAYVPYLGAWGGRRVRGPGRAGRRGARGGGRDDRRAAPGQRRAPAARPAVRVRRRARHPPARRPRRDDRRRRPVRRGRPHPRGADDGGGDAHRRRPVAALRAGSRVGRWAARCRCRRGVMTRGAGGCA